jgi:2-isopropylmalate synthase
MESLAGSGERRVESPKRLIVFDTTLRDGEQASGFHMYEDEKLEIAKALADMGVDVIEAGNPVSSEGDYRAVRKVCEEIYGPVIAGLSRCVEGDIIAAGRAIEPAAKRGKGRIHVYIGTSDIHSEKKLKKSREEIAGMAVGSVKRALEFTDDVEFSCEDFGRSDPAYTEDIISQVVMAGAKTITMPDTVGYRLPPEMEEMIREAIEAVTKRTGKVGTIYSVHCHNDLGLATANTIAAILGGVTQIEVAMNGIGERAGNAALEEVVAAIRERPEFFEKKTGRRIYTAINTGKIYSVSKMVSNITGKRPQNNKAIVGENAFSHEAGVHADGVEKDRKTYEWIRPEDYGRSSRLTFGPRSGRRGLHRAYKNIGLEFPDKEFDEIAARFKKLADRRKWIDDCDLVMAVVGDEDIKPEYALVSFKAWVENSSGMAEIRLKKGGEEYAARASGNGMINAAVKAINSITGMQMDISGYRSVSAMPGSEALGSEYVETASDRIGVKGHGLDTDTVRGAAKAYLDAANRMLYVKNYLGKKMANNG